MAEMHAPHDKSKSDAVIAQDTKDGKTRWLMRANDGQFYLRDSDENSELLSPEDAERMYEEMPDRRGTAEEIFRHD